MAISSFSKLPAGARSSTFFFILTILAIYLAGKDFSLRNLSGNFSLDELEKAVALAHAEKVKIYLACNIYARNSEQRAISEYLQQVAALGVDAVIISDPGIVATARNEIPETPIHLSTQANTTNANTARFWHDLKVARINAARELSLEEIREISASVDIEVETFVHGAMCVAYSGRCLLSSFMTGRESNRGACTHPCRWKYALVEDNRTGLQMPIEEDPRGTYILNSRDLCMIEHIPELIESDITSMKIEGRMKGINYVATTTKIYREAIDAYYKKPSDHFVKAYWLDELQSVGPRGYCTGFYFGEPDQIASNLENHREPRKFKLVAKVLSPSMDSITKVEVRNKIFKGDKVSILSRSGPSRTDVVDDILDDTGRASSFAQPGSIVGLVLKTETKPFDLIRRIEIDNEDS